MIGLKIGKVLLLNILISLNVLGRSELIAVNGVDIDLDTAKAISLYGCELYNSISVPEDMEVLIAKPFKIIESAYEKSKLIYGVNIGQWYSESKLTITFRKKRCFGKSKSTTIEVTVITIENSIFQINNIFLDENILNEIQLSSGGKNSLKCIGNFKSKDFRHIVPKIISFDLEINGDSNTYKKNILDKTTLEDLEFFFIKNIQIQYGICIIFLEDEYKLKVRNNK